MNKTFDVFMGRISGWHTYRVAQSQSQEQVNAWLTKGYRVDTEHQIGLRLHEIYLVPL